MAKRLFVAGLTLAMLGAAAFGAWLWRDWHRPYQGYGERLAFEVAKGRGAGHVLDALVDQGVVRSRVSLKLAFSATGRSRTIKAGAYLFDRPLTPLQVLDRLRRGDVILTKVTLPEGLRLDEAASLFASQGLGDGRAFLKALKDPGPIRDMDPLARDLEGYLFPDTYFVAPETSEAEIVRHLVGAFRGWWTAQQAAPRNGLTLREVVTLASVVEKETAVPAERPRIAGLFLNRLRIGMPLQSDPTVIYALVDDGRYRGFLTRADWSYPHPYNTYKIPALPPGPICSPGRAALEAVLLPEPSRDLYFVAKDDGTHAFSASLDDHNRAVARYRGGPRRP